MAMNPYESPATASKMQSRPWLKWRVIQSCAHILGWFYIGSAALCLPGFVYNPAWIWPALAAVSVISAALAFFIADSACRTATKIQVDEIIDTK